MEATRLSLREVRGICDRILGALADSKGDKVALRSDFYWSIPRSELYDVYREPSELTVGQIVDEIENLRTVVQGDGAVPPQALRWLGALLTAIGDELTA